MSFKLSSSDLAFPLGSLVLVTGASGFIASHIVDQILLAGYQVRGAVRDEKKAAVTADLFTQRHGAGKFSAVVVPEMSIDGAFDAAVKGVQGIVHVASDTSFSPDPNAVIPKTISGVIGLLRSASKEPSVKSFVFTSSTMAATGGIPGPNTVRVMTTESWNEECIKEAWRVTSEPFPPLHASYVYGASKAESEKVLWKYVEDEKPHFQINAVLPDANFGEVLSPDLSASTGAWIRMVQGSGTDLPEFIKGLPSQWYVNVIDNARVHVAALLSKSVNHERIYASAAPYTWNQILAKLRTMYPDRKFADDNPDAEFSNIRWPIERGAQLLKDVFGRDGWVGIEDTVADNVKGLE